MIIKTTKKERAHKRHLRLRKRVVGTKDRPRLSLYKSNKHLYAQLIDDTNSRTLLYCSTLQSEIKKDLKSSWTKESAKYLGELLARRALEKGIKTVVFDRGGNKYHGKVQAFAEGARACNLVF